MPDSDREDQADGMATALQLPAVQPFPIASDQTTLGQRWSKWIKGLEYFLIASNITDKKQRHAVLLHLAGVEVQTIFETLSDTGEDYDTALAKLTSILSPRRTFLSNDTHFGRQYKGQPKALMRMLHGC